MNELQELDGQAASADKQQQRRALKQHIIRKIAEMAKANGGIPPGCDRFSKATGIAHSVWSGQIWARWSDAVREAGCTPNTRIPRLEDEKMLGAFGAAARHYGRIPSNAELSLCRKSGLPVPVESTYRRHFGNKRVFLRHAKLWAAQSGDRADIAALLAGIDLAAPEPPKICGAVYLVQSGNLFKIGHSQQPKRRTRKIATSLPRASRVVHMILTDDPRGMEAYWHERFADKRSRGEWFKLTQEDVETFRKRKFM